MPFQRTFQEFKVEAGELADKVKEFIHQGNVRRIIIKDASGNTFMEIPLNIAAIGVVAAPILSAIGTLAALVAKFTVVIERTDEHAGPEAPPETKAPEVTVSE